MQAEMLLDFREWSLDFRGDYLSIRRLGEREKKPANWLDATVANPYLSHRRIGGDLESEP
jgi:hypothetical protein